MKKAIFETTQSEYLTRNGQQVEILRPLTSKECDIEEVGNMYKVKFNDGKVIDAFEDELIDTEKLVESITNDIQHHESILARNSEYPQYNKGEQQIINSLKTMLCIIQSNNSTELTTNEKRVEENSLPENRKIEILTVGDSIRKSNESLAGFLNKHDFEEMNDYYCANLCERRKNGQECALENDCDQPIYDCLLAYFNQSITDKGIQLD